MKERNLSTIKMFSFAILTVVLYFIMPDVLHSCAIIFELQQYLSVGNNIYFFLSFGFNPARVLYKKFDTTRTNNSRHTQFVTATVHNACKLKAYSFIKNPNVVYHYNIFLEHLKIKASY